MNWLEARRREINWRDLVIATVAALCLCGCSILGEVVKQLPAPVGTPTSVPQATATPTPSGTETPADPTSTASPSPAPAPTSTPAPKPTPDACPVMVKVGISPLGNYFRDFRGMPCVWIDATERWAGKFCPREDGCACNGEHSEVCSIDGKPGSPGRTCETDGKAIRWTLVSGVNSIFAPRHDPDDQPNVYHAQQIAICGKLGDPWIINATVESASFGGDGRPVILQFGFKPTVLRGSFK